MRANQAVDVGQTRFGPVQIGVIVLTLATAIIHLVVLNYFMGRIDVLFTLNGLGYLVLLAGLFLPVPVLQENRHIIRWLLIAFTLATILAWVVMGEKTLPQAMLGYITKAIEVVLVGLLLLDRRR